MLRAADPDFDHARLAFNLTVDQRPELIARPRDEGEVAAAVRHARDEGLRVAAQGAGHNAYAIDWSRPAMLLRTDAMNAVEIDVASRRASPTTTLGLRPCLTNSRLGAKVKAIPL